MADQIPTIRVLLVDDNQDIKNIIQVKLNRIQGVKYDLTWVTDTTNTKVENYDVVLLDHHLNLPDRSGIKILKEFRNSFCEVAVVFLTGDENFSTYREAKEVGANAFLRKKHLHAFDLMERIDFAILNAGYAKKFRQMAMRDHLTQLYNRAEMENRLKAEIARALRHEHSLSLIMLDIDYFKKINDRFGHPVGDAVLRQLSQSLQENCRQADVLCRYGGEEILIIMPETSLEASKTKAEQLRQLIAHTPIKIEQGEREIKITASFGVTEMIINEKWETLINRLDKALYQAKEAGRNQVVSS